MDFKFVENILLLLLPPIIAITEETARISELVRCSCIDVAVAMPRDARYLFAARHQEINFKATLCTRQAFKALLVNSRRVARFLEARSSRFMRSATGIKLMRTRPASEIIATGVLIYILVCYILFAKSHIPRKKSVSRILLNNLPLTETTVVGNTCTLYFKLCLFFTERNNIELKKSTFVDFNYKIKL